jgi:hypothetical protein
MLYFLFVRDKVLDDTDQIGDQSEQPEQCSCFSVGFWILFNDFKFGKNVKVVVNPIQAEEGSGEDKKYICSIHLWIFFNEFLYFFVLIDCFEKPEKFSCISHSDYG